MVPCSSSGIFIYKERERATNKVIDVLRDYLHLSAYGEAISIFNDFATHAEVMRVLEEADV